MSLISSLAAFGLRQVIGDGVENVVDQVATHRRAGLEPAFGLQYFAQLGSGSQHEQKIRKGGLL